MNVTRYRVIRYVVTLQEVISVVVTMDTHWMVSSVLVRVYVCAYICVYILCMYVCYIMLWQVVTL